MTTNGGGFAVFQRRHANTESFRRRWVDYKSGFGNLSADFWLGNDNLHTLTERSQELLIELGDFKGDTAHASFGLFLVGSEAEKYVMRVGEYTGTAGDSFSAAHDGIFFTTDDRNNDGNANENCAVMFHGGWWFNNCHESNLNGQYVEGGDVQEGRGISWKSWKGADESLQSTTMKLRPLKGSWEMNVEMCYSVAKRTSNINKRNNTSITMRDNINVHRKQRKNPQGFTPAGNSSKRLGFQLANYRNTSFAVCSLEVLTLLSENTFSQRFNSWKPSSSCCMMSYSRTPLSRTLKGIEKLFEIAGLLEQ